MEIIKHVGRVTTGLLSSEPASTHDTSFVYKNVKGESRLVENGAQLSRLELRGSRYTIRYSVERSAYSYRHISEYPSKVPGKTFRVTLQFSVSVEDPIKVVEYDIKNIRDYLNENVSYWMAPLFQVYAIEDFREVQQLVESLDSKTELLKDLKDRGIKVTQFQATVGLSESDWGHFKKIEEMKKQQEIELRKIQEQKELEKERMENESELARKQVEINDIKKQHELMLKEKELEAALRELEKKNDAELKERAKKVNAELEEKQKLLNALKKEGEFGKFVLTSESAKDVNEAIKKDLEERNEMKKLIMKQYINQLDFSDPDSFRKIMGTIMDLGTPSNSKQITHDAPSEKRLSWKANMEENAPEKLTVPPVEEWEEE
ncbi:hypothetical protein [Gottfriedia acidiceleris]|uniref:hypothetical protein n=1 Tax=Gottfriedia acidiceleris TaxID=371036 RepID=UPI003000BC99